jgi:hypothetical protein
MGVLLWRPAEWVLAINSLVPDVPLLAWIVSNAALWVVLAYGLLAARLLRTPPPLPTPSPHPPIPTTP